MSGDGPFQDERDAGAEAAAYRCGYVALAGRPNVGKSTLLNRLVGQHLSIVSSKAQTTRERVAGVWTGPGCQMIFLDAPGLLEPEYALQEAMRWAAERALDDADVVVLVADATRPDTLPQGELQARLRSRGVPTRVAVNKVDQVDAATLDGLLARAAASGWEGRAISARTGQGVEALRAEVAELLPESPPLYPPEDAATRPVRFFVEEYVRETCMDLFREEVPYSVACRVEEFREDREPVYIRASIYVERESQKGIVVGKGGSAIRRVGTRSREKIEALLGRRVYLDLQVKVLARWSRKRSRLRHLGFELPPGPGRRGGR